MTGTIHRAPTPIDRILRSAIRGAAFCLLLPLLIISCAKQSYYDIDTRTDVRSDGNTVIRWQVNPGMEGTVKIYASGDASSYPTEPVVVESIAKQYTTIPFAASHYEAQYFLMVFGGIETRVVSSRIIPTISFTNLRDAGGYMTKEGEQVKWGGIYRSNILSGLTRSDSLVVASLGLRYQVLLRDLKGGDGTALPEAGFRRIAIDPDIETARGTLRDRVIEGRLDAPGVIDARQDLLSSYAFENPNQLSAALHALLDESNYPVLLSDRLGNGRIALLMALVQSALGIPQRDIIDDYMLSNALVPVAKLEPEGYKYPPLVQEALVELYKNRPNDLQYVFYEINKRYGSVERYLKEFLSFDKADIERLRHILLY